MCVSARARACACEREGVRERERARERESYTLLEDRYGASLDGNHTSFQTMGSEEGDLNRLNLLNLLLFHSMSRVDFVLTAHSAFNPCACFLHFSMFVCLSSSVFSRCDQALASMDDSKNASLSAPDEEFDRSLDV